MQTQALQKELSQGLLRVALEGEKRPEKDKTSLMDEPVWTMYANGKKSGYVSSILVSFMSVRMVEIRFFFFARMAPLCFSINKLIYLINNNDYNIKG